MRTLLILALLSCASCSFFDSILGTADTMSNISVSVDTLVSAGAVFGDKSQAFTAGVLAADENGDGQIQGFVEMKELLEAVFRALGIELGDGE